MSKFCLIFIALTIFSKVNAEAAKKSISPFSAKMLSGEELNFPINSPTLFLIGFEKSCIWQIREWIVAIRREKLLPSKTPCYVVFMVDPKLKKSLFVNLATYAITKAIPQKEHNVVGLAASDPKYFKDILNYDNRSQGISVALVNDDGIIQWKHQGSPNSLAKETLKEISNSA